jgi:hypothetical protein
MPRSAGHRSPALCGRAFLFVLCPWLGMFLACLGWLGLSWQRGATNIEARPSTPSPPLSPRWWPATSSCHAMNVAIANATPPAPSLALPNRTTLYRQAERSDGLMLFLASARAERNRAEPVSGRAPCWRRGTQRRGGRAQRASSTSSPGLFERNGAAV